MEIIKFVSNIIILVFKISVLLSTFYTFSKGGIELSCLLQRKGALADVTTLPMNISHVNIYLMESHINELNSSFKSDGEFANWEYYSEKEEKYYYIECYVENIGLKQAKDVNEVEVYFDGDYFHTYASPLYSKSVNRNEKIISNCFFAIYEKECKLTTKVTNNFYIVILSILLFSILLFCVTYPGYMKTLSLILDHEIFYTLIVSLLKIFKLLGIECSNGAYYCYNKDGLIYKSGDSGKKVLRYKSGRVFDLTEGFNRYKDLTGEYVIFNGHLYHNGEVFNLPSRERNNILRVLKDVFWFNEYFGYPAVIDGHCLNMYEIVDMINFSGYFDIEPIDTGVYKGINDVFHYYSTNKNLDKKLVNDLRYHYQEFSKKGKIGNDAIVMALSARIRFFDKPEDCGNAAWKMYCSDVKRLYNNYGIEIKGCNFRAPTDSYNKTVGRTPLEVPPSIEDQILDIKLKDGVLSVTNESENIILKSALKIKEIDNKVNAVGYGASGKTPEDKSNKRECIGKESKGKEKYEELIVSIKNHPDYDTVVKHNREMEYFPFGIGDDRVELSRNDCKSFITSITKIKKVNKILKTESDFMSYLRETSQEDLYKSAVEQNLNKNDASILINKFSELNTVDFFKTLNYLSKAVNNIPNYSLPTYLTRIKLDHFDNTSLHEFIGERVSRIVKEQKMTKLYPYFAIKDEVIADNNKTDSTSVDTSLSMLKDVEVQVNLTAKSCQKIILEIKNSVLAIKRQSGKRRKSTAIKVAPAQPSKVENFQTKSNDKRKKKKIGEVVENIETTTEIGKFKSFVKPTNKRTSPFVKVTEKVGSNISLLLNLSLAFIFLGKYPGRDFILDFIKNSTLEGGNGKSGVKFKSKYRKTLYKKLFEGISNGNFSYKVIKGVLPESFKRGENKNVQLQSRDKGLNKRIEEAKKDYLRGLNRLLFIHLVIFKNYSLDELDDYIINNGWKFEDYLVNKSGINKLMTD